MFDFLHDVYYVFFMVDFMVWYDPLCSLVFFVMKPVHLLTTKDRISPDLKRSKRGPPKVHEGQDTCAVRQAGVRTSLWTERYAQTYEQ